MKYKFLLLTLLISTSVFAQNGSINGKIANPTGIEVSFANVVLKNTKKGTIANEKGEFLIENVAPGKYTLQMTAVGFETIGQSVEVLAGQTTSLKFTLKEKFNSLSEVRVVGDIGITKVKPQTIQYQTKDLISQNGGTAGDILKAMPSVAMGGSPNHNRDIRFRGLGNGYTQVLINGQPVGVNGNNRETVLDLIPANQIERIEILANPTADVVSMGVNGVVNIILKQGIPSTKLYDANGKATFVADHLGGYNGGLNLSGRAKNFTVGGSFDRLYRIVDNNSDGDIKKYNASGELTETQLQKKHETKRFTNQTAKAFAGFNKNGWDLYTEYMYGEQEEDKDKSDITTVFDAANKLKSGKHVLAPEIKKVYFHNPSVRLTKTLGKSEFQIAYNFNRSGEDKIVGQNEYTANADGSAVLNKIPKMQRVEDAITLNTHLPSFYWSTSVIKNTVVKVGYQGFMTQRNIFRKTEVYSEKTNLFELKSDAKNNFEANENVNAAFATFQWNTEKLKMNFGYRHEIAEVRTKSEGQASYSLGNYSTPLPSIHAQYFITPKTYVASSVGRRIRRPGFNDLNPFLEIKSVTEHKVGNPELQPELAWAYELGMFTQLKNNFNIGANFFVRDIKNLIQRNITSENGIFIEKPINIRGARTSGIELISAAKVGKWLNVNANYSKFWSKISSQDITNGDQLKDQFAWTAKAMADVKLPYRLSIQVVSNWVGPKNTLQEGEGQVQFVDFGIQKEFGKGNFLFLRGTDLFDTLKKHKYVNTPTQISNTFEQTQGRVFSLGASVNF